MFSIALSGGSTPKGLFQLLATPAWRDRIDWSKTHVFWGEDRYVPHTDQRSNFRMARETPNKESRATWNRLADRWVRCAELEEARPTPERRVPRYRHDERQIYRHAS